MDAAEPAELNTLATELGIEQSHVDKVYERLESETQIAKEAKRQGQEIFKTDRADYVREEHSTAMFERDAFAYQAAKRIAVLDAEHEGLVFGRLDLTDKETRYIGRIGVRDEEYEPLVIDWRAPAAEPFYRATSTTPMNVVRRRVLQCRNDKVIGIEDDLVDTEAETDLVVLGEGALMASLTRARSHNMRDIVATIQAEQDEAIRAPYQGVTIITGGPGTGKTVVALHRAAYLLYTNRKRLENGGVMVVGPSPVFMNYIERVLPSLGEDSVTLKSIGHLATDVLGYGSERIDPAAAATVKGSLRMAAVLKRLIEEPMLSVEDGFELKVSAKGEILSLSTREIARIRMQVLSNQKLNRARNSAEKLILDALYAKLPDSVMEDVTRDFFEDMVSGQASFVNFMNAWWPAVGPEEVLIRLADLSLVRRVGAGILSEDEQNTLATSYQQLLARGQVGNHFDWSVADIALLDELAALLGPKPVEEEHDPVMFLDSGAGVTELVTTADVLSFNRESEPAGDPHNTYAHVLVDESQDVTPMQWLMLRRRGPYASWTLVGDVAQSSYPDTEESEQALQSLIGQMPHRTFKLTTNYRSPSEVFDLAAKVVRSVHPQADLPKAIRSTGVDPVLLTATPEGYQQTVVESVLKLSKRVAGTIGVICPPSLLDEVQQELDAASLPAELDERLVTVTPLQTKGLEYDGVLVISPDQIVDESPGGMRVLYVALTRPTQYLATIDLVNDPAWRKVL